ncbi:hypothetical protein K501DRAFT_178366 [Backusella circina FSU 941]|nr:hypothetical protein K501DRAFT_178366 [Backusella circina FSU 941]
MNNTNPNYCLDSMSRRSSLCPPHHESDSVLSPPLTPALSQHHPFDKRQSADLSYSSNHYTRPAYPHHHHHHYQQLQQPPSQEQHPPPPQAQQPQQQQQRPMMNERTIGSTRKQPSKQNKHMCNFPDCMWSFKRFEHLKRHMLVHTGERPHVCPHPGCGKRFSRSDNFHAHYRTHEKKAFARQKQDPNAAAANTFHMNPYYQQQGSYPLLPTPSPKQDNYMNHYHDPYLTTNVSPPRSLLNAADEQKKPHLCNHPNCEKRFRRLEHLKRHMRIHTHEQPFKCNFPGCLKAFSRSDNLTQHRKTHERRDSRYQKTVPCVDPLSNAPQFMHPEPFTLVDFIREGGQPSSEYPSSSPSSEKLPTPYSQGQSSPIHHHHPMLGWQHPGDTPAESVGC